MADIIELPLSPEPLLEEVPETTPADLLRELQEDASNIKALAVVADTNGGIHVSFSAMTTAQLVVMAKILDMEVQERLIHCLT
jgi:hypothetical protein